MKTSRWDRTVALLIAVCAVLITSVVPVDAIVPGVIATADCDQTWNRGGGSFSDADFMAADSWAENVAPDKSATVCFPTGDVLFFALAGRSVGAIDVAAGASLRLNGGSLDLTSTSSIGGLLLLNGALLEAAAEIMIPEGREGGFGHGQFGTIRTTSGATLTVEGTLTRSGGNTGVLDLDVVNNGEVSLSGTLALGSGRTFSNAGHVAISNSTITTNGTPTTLARFSNTSTGVVEFEGGVGGPDAAGARNLVFDNDGVVRVSSGDVSLMMSGTSTGDWEVGTPGGGSCAAPVGSTPTPGARLYFRPTSTITLTDGDVSGPGCLNVFGGTVAAGSASTWMPGATELNGATLRLAGDRTLPQVRVANGGTVAIDDGIATMTGPLSQTNPGQFVRLAGNGRLVVPAGVPFNHIGGNGLSIGDSVDVVVGGPTETSGSVIVEGTATFTSTGDWTIRGQNIGLSAAAGTTVRNEGTLTLAPSSSTLFGGASGFDNVGTVRVASGVLDMRTPFRQFDSGRLTGGRIEVATGARIIFFPRLTSLAGEIRLEGTAHLDASFGTSDHSLALYSRIEPTGALEIVGDAGLGFSSSHTDIDVVNEGRLRIEEAGLATARHFTQTSTGVLELDGRPEHAPIVAAQTGEVAGTLRIVNGVAGQDEMSGTAILIAPGPLTGTFDVLEASDGGTVTLEPGPDVISFRYLAASSSPIPPIVATPSASVTEGTGGVLSQQVQVTIENPNPFPLPIAWTGAGLTATLGTPGATGVDANVPGGGATLTPGTNVIFVPFLTQGDSLAEDDETFQILWAPGAPLTTVTIVDDDDPPPVLTFGAATFTESSGGGSVTVTRQSAKAPLSVAVVSIDGTATAGQDYDAISTTISFAQGQLSTSAFVDIIDDDADEPDETFTLSFASGAFTKTVTILDDDDPPPPPPPTEPEFVVRVEAFGPYNEDVGTVSLNVRLDRTLAVPVTFLVRTIDGTAEAGEDFVGITDLPVTIPAGATEGPTVQVTIIDDDEAYELDRELFAVVAARNDVDLAGDVIEIINNDTGPQARLLRQTSDGSGPLVRSLHEGDATDPTLPLLIELLGDPITEPTTVTITAQSFSADPDEFSIAPTELTFLPGDGPKTVVFTSHGDTDLEDDELVIIAIASEFGDLLGRVDDTALVTILDDDQDLTFTPSLETTVAEGAGILTVTITADHAPGQFVTVPVRVEGITATVEQPPVVFFSPSAIDGAADVGVSVESVTFAPTDTSRTFEIPIRQDAVPEGDETFSVSFGPATQGKVVPSEFVVTITDDDPAAYSLSVADVTVTEGELIRLEVVATPTAPGMPRVTLPAFLTDVTTDRVTDYTPASGTNGSITIPAGGGTVFAFVLPGNDARFEVTEFLKYTVGRAEVPGERVEATITIEDDDPFPTVTILAPTPVNEDVGSISVIVRAIPAPGSPITIDVNTVDGFAEAGEDYVALARSVTIAAGSTQAATLFVEIIDDTNAFELDRESFAIEATRGSDDLAVAVVEIIDNDTGPQARFVRQPADPVSSVFVRRLVEGNTTDTTLPLQVELLGDPITAPTTVRVTAQSFFADDDDFSIAPVELVFLPGDGPKTVTFTAFADTEVEIDEPVIVALATDFGDSLGRADDEAHVTIANDDQDLTLTPVVAATATEGATISVTVEADHAPGEFVTIPVSIVGISATVPGDVVTAGVPTSLTIGPDETSASFLLTIGDDDVPEPDEVFQIRFGTPNQGTLTVATKDVTIIDDDPAPYVLTVEEMTVVEGEVFRIEVVATPTVPNAPAAVLPAFVSDVTTDGENVDWVAGANADGTIAIPAGGGTVIAFVRTVDDDRFEVTEFLRFTVGRASVPGERVFADLTVEDDDPFPNVTIQVNSPVNEDVGSISVIVRVDHAPGSPVSMNLRTVDGTAEAGEDFVAIDRSVTIPNGFTQAATVFLQIIDDKNAFELDRESFALEVTRGSDDLAVALVEIIDNDTGPQARFVRQPADPPTSPLVRRLVEGDITDTTLPLQVEMLGDPITGPTIVTVVAQALFADEEGYDVSPLELTFVPGGPTTQTVTFTARADLEIEVDEVVIVALQTEFGDLLGRVDDEAQVTIVNDDVPPGATPVEQFSSGWDDLLAAIQEWLSQFDLLVAESPAVVTRNLAQHFDLPNLFDDLDLPTFDPSIDTMPELCAALAAAGFTLNGVAGGECVGVGEPATPGDLLDVSFDVTLEDLLKAIGFSGDPFNDATQGVLQSLASALGLNGLDGLDSGWLADLTLNLDLGVDGDGFFVGGDTSFDLDLGGSLNLGGNGNVAGTSTPLNGLSTADLTVSLVPPIARLRDLGALLDVQLDGTANMSVSFATGPLSLTWNGEWTMGSSGVTVGPQTISGSLALPGLQLRSSGVAATLDVTGSFDAGVWTLTANGLANAEYLLGGFDVGSIAITATLSPTFLSGDGSIVLSAPMPSSTPTHVTIDVGFTRTQLSIDGRLELPELGVGAPELLRLVEPFVQVGFDASLPSGPLTGGIEVGAEEAIVLPADPVGTATGVLGSLTSAGALTLHADTMSANVADGAIEIDLAEVDFAIGDGTGPNLFAVGTATGTFPALDDLSVTLTGFFLTKAGVFGATSVAVASQGLAQSIGLGGVLPFDVTAVTVVFPTPSSLDSFEVSVVGSFDFSVFPTIPGFTPRVGLGGPVVTPSSPPEENTFTFSVDVESLAEGIVRPLDIGPITLGFDGLQAGDATIGADITLGGFVDGEFQSEIGGALRVDGAAGSILDDVEVTLSGSITPGTTTVADISGQLLLSGSFGPLVITDLDLRAGVLVSLGPGGLTIEPRLDGLDVGSVELPFGDLMTLRMADVEIDFAPPAGGNILEVGNEGGLTVGFDDSFPVLAGWTGTFANFAVGDDFIPKLLPGFSFDLDVPDDLNFGLPEFIPLTLGAIGISFPNVVTAPPGGVRLTPDLLAGLRIRVSGGIEANATWPISAAVDGLEVDLGLLVQGQFPITNLDGISMGVEPFELPGGVVIGGGLELGTVEVDGTTVFYGRVFGDFSVADIGGGADLVVTQYGPVLMKVRAPLGIPLGPSGIVLAGVEGAAQFGSVGIPVPPVGDPVALLNSFTLPTDLQITEQVIIDAVRPIVDDETPSYTWDQGFALALAGELIVAAAPGILKGTATIGMNLGLPDGPNDPPGLQLVGKGEVTAFGIPLGLAGFLVDFSEPLAPSFDFAFASPVPGSPLAIVFPASATFGVQLRTDGVVLGTIEGLRIFVQKVLDGSLQVGGELFGAVIDELAASLDASRLRPFAQLLLDVDGNGTVSPAENARTITGAFLIDRVLGRNGFTALLPSSPSGAAFDRAAKAATALFNELLLMAGAILDDPQRFGSFTVADPGAIGFEGLVGPAGNAMAAMADVIRDATSAALAAFGERFNPSFVIEGALQPTFLGLPLGSPLLGGGLTIDRSGLFFEMTGSLTEIGQAAVGGLAPPVAPLINAIMSAATLGLSDEISIGARLPFGGIVDSLIGGSNLPTFQPLDPNWAVTFNGSVSVLGYEGAELSGMAFLPNQRTFLETRVQKLYELPVGTPIDPNRIPVSTEARFDSLVEFGGILVTASLRMPRLLIDPAAHLATFPAPPADPFAYGEWLQDVAATATQTDTPARIQYFVPGVLGITSDATAVDWAESLYVEGVWNGKILGLDLGRGTLSLTPAGLEIAGQFPLLGLTANVTVNTALLSGGTRLPSAGVDLQLDAAMITSTLTGLGVPSTFLPPIDATGRFRAFTPGFEPGSTDPVRRNGGIEVQATLGTPGVIGNTNFTFAVTPRAGGVDIHGRANAPQIGPIAGVTITDATVQVDVVNGVASVTVDGNAAVLGASATVHAVLAGDLTGTLQITFTSGTMNLAGASVAGSATLTTTRVNGQLRGSLAINGTATLPSWLATAAGSATLAVAACVDTAGNAEVALTMPAMSFGPSRLVRVGRNPNAGASLPPSPAACTLPAGAPGQSATGPLFRLRVANGVATAVLNGSIDFTGPGASLAGMTVSGALDSRAGTGSLSVAFAAGGLSLSGLSVTGDATATIGPGTFSMSVDGRLTVPGIITNASVSGTATQAGITRLNIAVGALTLAPLTVNSFTLGLDRTAASTYRLTVGANVAFAGIGAMRIDGALDSAGNGTLAVTGTTLSIGGASITNGAFSITRAGSTTTLSASGRFAFFGLSLEVVQASLTLTGGLTGGISGSLVIRPVGGGALSIGGFAIGGTLRINFAGLTSSISITNGTVTLPGWGTFTVTAAISVPVASGSFFQMTLPSGGLRLGGADSPFFATGSFRLSFVNGVVTFSASNAGVSWRSGATTLASVTAPLLQVSSNGAASVTMNSLSATLPGGFAFTVPSVSLFLDAQGLNARLSLGAGSLTIPGLPTVSTSSFQIGTASTFTHVLVANALDLGVITLRGRLVFERQSGVFRLRLDSSPSLEIEGLVTVPLPSFTVSSDGTFVVDATFPLLGVSGFQISGASLRLEKTGTALSTLAGRITGGRLLVNTADPIPLPTLRFGAGSRFDETFTLTGWELGPFLRTSSIQLRVRQLATGVIELTVVNAPTVTAFAGSASMVLTSFTAASNGTFTGTVTGRLALFGRQLAQSSFTLTRDGSAVRLTLASPALIDFGFLSARLSGFARSTGSFAFSGSTSVSLGVTGFSFSGTLSVGVNSANGLEGSFSGRVCIIACATTSGTLRSDGRIRGLLRIDLNNDGDFRDFGEVDAEWLVYLATGGVRVDINRDGDYNDLGDIVIGTATAGDVTDPTMATPPNITVIANIGSGGLVRVYYNVPSASDSGVSLPVRCSPAPGTEFGAGTTTVSCSATDRADNTTTKTFVVTVIADPAQAVPTATNGATVAVTAPGFQPFSMAFVTIRSDPTYLGLVTADANGNINLDVLIPDLAPGHHDIIIEGLGVRGGVWQYVQPIFVPGGITAPASVPVDPAGRVDPPASPAPDAPGAPIPPIPGTLPRTGGDGGVGAVAPIAVWLMTLGVVLLLLARRRRLVS